MQARSPWLWLTALVLVILGVTALPLGRWALWRRELNPILRGRILAERQGCPGCHLPFAAVEIPNPGSRWGSVPRFQAGNATMYASSRLEIEEFIRFGAPRSWLEDPRVLDRLEKQRLRMPAFGTALSDAEIADLTAFASAVEGVELPEGEGVVAGRSLAREHGCLSCHGVEGSGGLANPGSLGGFIPGFAGGNFEDLVRSKEEFREWVLDGSCSRLAGNPVIRFFWRRQRLSMPAYRGALDDGEIDQLWLWVQALARHPKGVRSPLAKPK